MHCSLLSLALCEHTSIAILFQWHYRIERSEYEMIECDRCLDLWWLYCWCKDFICRYVSIDMQPSVQNYSYRRDKRKYHSISRFVLLRGAEYAGMPLLFSYSPTMCTGSLNCLSFFIDHFGENFARAKWLAMVPSTIIRSLWSTTMQAQRHAQYGRSGFACLLSFVAKRALQNW